MSTNSLTDQVECKDLPGDSRATGRWLNIRTGGKVGDHCDPIGAPLPRDCLQVTETVTSTICTVLQQTEQLFHSIGLGLLALNLSWRNRDFRDFQSIIRLTVLLFLDENLRAGDTLSAFFN